MLKRSGYQSRTAFVSRSWMEQDKSASPVWSQTMPLLVICVTSTCWTIIRKVVLAVGWLNAVMPIHCCHVCDG